MANRNIAAAVRFALLAAGTAGAAMYAPGSVAQDQEIEQIVVTGSRIARPGVEEASPIAVVGAQEIALQGTQNIENILNTLPQVVATTTSASNNPGGGVATVNLRNLGEQRTLVLVDGKRYLSYDVNQIVDLNTVPAPLIERIDVVTGGRSAVYGSDAIAGVVNFVMKRNFEGVEFNTNYGTGERGDADTYGMDVTVGGNFADDRGNAVLHASYFNRSPLFADSRSFTRVALTDGIAIGAPGTLFPGGSSSIPGLRGSFGSLGNIKFAPDGSFSPYSAATDSYNFAPSNYLQVPQERYLVYGKADFEVNDHFKPYVEGQFINNRVDSSLAPTPIGNTTPGVSSRGGLQVHVYSPFLSASSQAALQGLDTDGNGYVTPSGSWGRRMSEMGNRENLDDRNAYRVLVGAEGDVVADWTYDLSYMFARTKNSNGQNGNIAISRFLAGTRTAFDDGDGNISVTPWNLPGLPNGGAGTLVCSDAGARAAGCVPINIFGAGNVSGEAVDYMKIGTINGETAETMMTSLIFTNPNVVDLWAGPLGLAFGAEYREEYGQNQTDEFLAGGDVAGFNPSDPTEGDYNVTDFLLELTLPLLKDVPGAEMLEFNGAYRYSDYSTSVGAVDTYSAGLQWAPVRGLTVRGQYQRAIRAPSVAELFLGQTVSFDGAIDPCQDSDAALPGELRDRCIANGVPASVVGTDYSTGGTSFPATQGGNPDLIEETADTYTVGVVLQPSFLPNFVATVDYYNIKIDDVITTGVGVQNLVDACFTYGVTALCNNITRTSDGEFESFVDTNVNAATLETEGVDVDLGYDIDIGAGLFGSDGSNLGFRLFGTYVISNDYSPIDGLPIINECAGAFGRNCGAPDPEWRHSFRTTWSTGPMDLSLMWRYMTSVEDDDDIVLYGREKFDAKSYFDATFGWEFLEGLQFNFGVDNLFNEKPQLGASVQQFGNMEQSNTYPTVYDVIGRYYWATLKVKF
jgi:outer membrane receptor protein involved in Fe transport